MAVRPKVALHRAQHAHCSSAPWPSLPSAINSQLPAETSDVIRLFGFEKSKSRSLRGYEVKLVVLFAVLVCWLLKLCTAGRSLRGLQATWFPPRSTV
jgi:hypothetical protein